MPTKDPEKRRLANQRYYQRHKARKSQGPDDDVFGVYG
jgi:hypothetical protein